MKIEVINEKEKSQELLPQIVERIFLICRNDPNFKLKNEMEIVENKSESIKRKIEKQDLLLSKSHELKKDMINRLEVLKDQNQSKQIQLLEDIGGEL